jgi:hypothetical protein
MLWVVEREEPPSNLRALSESDELAGDTPISPIFACHPAWRTLVRMPRRHLRRMLSLVVHRNAPLSETGRPRPGQVRRRG